MPASLLIITILVYILASALLYRERSLRYLLLLAAGHLATLLTPLWQRIYGVSPVSGGSLSLFGRFDVPWAIIIGGGPLLALPPFVFYFGLRHRWWPRHYVAICLGYAVFVMYFLVLEALLQRNGAFLLSDALVVIDTPIPPQLVQAMLLGGVSLGMLYTLVSTRHYALEVAILPLLVSGIVSALLFLGIFASPLWVSHLLGQPNVIVTAGAAVSLMLVLWGVHLLASGLHAGRRQQFIWR